MKALTLTQPWATLVAIGAKKIETRSWSTNYRGPIAIHAAKNFPKYAKDLCVVEPFYSALLSLGLVGGVKHGLPWIGDIPLGCVLATCNLVRVDKIKHEDYALHITRDERAFGNYSAGRFAWILEDAKTYPEPIPAKGMLGLWELIDEDYRDYYRPVY